MRSMIGRSIMSMVPIAEKQMQSWEFAWQECINASLIWAEECYVTQDITNDVKRIREGAETTGNVKNKPEINITRAPVLCCRNYEP